PSVLPTPSRLAGGRMTTRRCGGRDRRTPKPALAGFRCEPGGSPPGSGCCRIQQAPEQSGACVVVAHTGFEPVISALRGRCPRPLDECATFRLSAREYPISRGVSRRAKDRRPCLPQAAKTYHNIDPGGTIELTESTHWRAS